jgi:acyl dehydratase
MTTEIMAIQAPIKRYFEDVEVGEELPKLVKAPVTHLQLVRYAGASGDFNPLHTDPKVGEMVGTGGIIAHGMLIMGFVGQLLSDYVGPTALRKFGVRFKGMTHLDDVITCTGVVTDKYEANGEARIVGKVQATDQNGDVKVTGTFEAALPHKSA